MSNSSVIDTALDRTVALGYGNVGLWVRRRLPDWPADPPRMDGRAVLVTGAASGIGNAASVGFARLGARVYVLGRDPDRAREAAELVLAMVPGADVRGVDCDLGDLRAIHAFAERFAEDEDRLDVLVNNAGVMPDDRERTVDGHELTFATHVLALHALTERLAGLLAANDEPGRIINVTSGGAYDQGPHADDPQSEDDKYSPKKIYARTKRQQLILTELWADKLRDENVVVHSMHPGWADTKGVRNWMPVFRALTRPIVRTPAEGADTIVWLGGALEPGRDTGGFWHDRRRRPTHYLIGASEESREERDELWHYVEERATPTGAAAR